jgi:FkbM family methyltransferase
MSGGIPVKTIAGGSVMKFVPWLWRLVSDVGLILRQGHSHGRIRMLRTFLKIELKRFFLAGLLKRRMTRESIFGYQVHFFDYQIFATLFEELYVAEVYYFSTSSPEPLIVDCGSNIGLSVLYFKRLYPKAKVIAFEPDNETFGMLELNVRANNLTGVTLVKKALYDSVGSVPFYVSPEQPGMLVQSTRKENLASSRVTSVETEMLSTYLTEPVDFLKMDIEGAEDQVLKDLNETGKLALVREIVLEYHHHLTPREDKLGVFLKTLEQTNFGYQLKAALVPPFRKGEFQALILYAYQLNGA